MTIKIKPFLTCILFLACTISASCTCPTGNYTDEANIVYELSTIDGTVSGKILDPGFCASDYLVSGTSDGANIFFRADSENPYPSSCCTSAEFTLVADTGCAVLDGTVDYPLDSSCHGAPSSAVSLTKQIINESTRGASVFLP